MNKQDAARTGNKHSSLIDQMVAAAEAAAPKPTVFQDSVLKIANNKSPDLKTILAGIQKTAQFDAMGEDEMGLPDAGMPGAEDPLGEEGMEADVEGGKASIAEALIALCGGPEEAKACIDAAVPAEEGMPGEGMPGEGMPGEGMPGEGMPPAPEAASPMPSPMLM